MTYGDKDPADAYDAADPPPVRLAVVERIAAALEHVDHPGRRGDGLRLAASLDGLGGVDPARLAAAIERLEHG